MNEEIIMSKEAFEELVNGFEFIESLTKCGRINIKYHIQKLQEENKKLTKKYNKALQLLADCNLPCDIDNFNTKEENIDYCSQNCSVDESIFIKCWDRFIEQELESDKSE